ncbi:MAG: M15 family metallopeptidase [Actinomycetota bacterium]
MRSRVVVLWLGLALLATACGNPPAHDTAPATRDAGSRGPTGVLPAAGEASPSPALRLANSRARFRGSIRVIDARTRARMVSWRPGCPVPIRDLRLLTLYHWGFDGTVKRGKLIVHEDVAGDVLSVFRRLFYARFPIRRMRLVDEYDANDDRSMAANNTSAFNCRKIRDSSRWSEHAYGWAIDINPVQNPYIRGNEVVPPAGKRYVDRSKRAKGMVHARDVVVRAFEAIGWGWGGYWRSSKDYQHFSLTGR